jgi:hypothetical protein
MDCPLSHAVPVNEEQPTAPASLVNLCKEALQLIHTCIDWDGEGNPLDNYDIKGAFDELSRFTPVPDDGGFTICKECGGNGYTLERSGMGEEQEPTKCLECDGKGRIPHPAQENKETKATGRWVENDSYCDGCIRSRK